jgi:hypothetical protein
LISTNKSLIEVSNPLEKNKKTKIKKNSETQIKKPKKKMDPKVKQEKRDNIFLHQSGNQFLQIKRNLNYLLMESYCLQSFFWIILFGVYSK